MRVNVFFNDTATTEIYTLSLHDALPISATPRRMALGNTRTANRTTAMSSARRYSIPPTCEAPVSSATDRISPPTRSEEHTSELQSRQYLVCRLLLEKKKKAIRQYTPTSA